MDIKADEITKIIQNRIRGYQMDVDIQEVGTVTSVGDGIAQVYGLDRVMYNELLEFPNDVFGLALNLEEDSVGTVLLGLLLLLAVYLLIIFIISRKGPIDFLRSVRDVLLLAFSTSSSAVVMPLSIKTAEEKLGVRPSISQFVIPLGATINMNGTALYQSIAAVKGLCRSC